MINKQLLSILACPVSKASLTLSDDETELLCTASRLAYPINDGIPVLLEEQARKIGQEEYEALTK
ncbi:MAG: Trm112 family protein [Saccharospirillaceae bacterium]|nr:Trm112 family protein [Saccharospirillaceae bacterium]